MKLRGKIDDAVLFRLLVEQQRTQREAAAYFGCSEAAVSKRVHALNWDLTRHVGLERAKAVADRGLDVVAQLQQINAGIQEELRWALTEARQPGANRRALADTIVTLTAEIRRQLGLQLEIIRTLYDVKAAADFQAEVLSAVGEASPEVRRAIIARLVEKRALRSATQLAPAGG